MPIRSCRGRINKQRIYDLYDLELGPYCKIPGHQRGEGERNECCGIALTDEFVQFFYEPRSDGEREFDREFPEESGSFFVGRPCAQQFIALMAQDDPDIHLPPPFDPFRPPPRRGGQGGGRNGGGDGPSVRPPAPTPLNFEVMTVLQLLATVCRTPLTARMNTALNWLRKNPDRDTRDWCVHAVNAAVANHREMQGRSLREAMEEEEALGQDRWREFTFHNIERVLRADGVQSHIDPGAELPADPPLRRPASVVAEITGGHRLHVHDDGSEPALFADALEESGIPAIGIGDLLLVRLGEFPRGPRAVKVYEIVETGVAGTVKYVGPNNNFAFMAREAGGDVFIPRDVYHDAGCPSVDDRLAARIEAAEKGPRATWARAIR